MEIVTDFGNAQKMFLWNVFESKIKNLIKTLFKC